jgi:hypothetical protein
MIQTTTPTANNPDLPQLTYSPNHTITIKDKNINVIE